MSKKQEGFIQVLLIVGILVISGLIVYLLLTPVKSSQVSNNYSPVSTPSATPQPQQTDQEVGSYSKTLDETDMAEFDTELNALNTDSLSF